MIERAGYWFRFASPRTFYPLAGMLIPWLSIVAAALAVAGLYVGFFIAPTDAQQGEGYRIIFVHVPVSWMSMFIYLVMAGWAGVGLAFNSRMAGMMASALAPTGAMFTFLSLWTGALWGKPMWGTWWVWDGRLTSVLILFFLYLGYMALWSAYDEPGKASRAAAILALVGVINVPIIHFSVEWWNTLHQPASVFKIGGPSIDPSMLWPLLVMALGFTAYFVVVLLWRMRAEILARRIHILMMQQAAS